ncbi:hypothetical protein HORIV_44640 [Vreelandella olivaria]|uniref:Uncharacterized protein n=1 Tax=Vreelandella olivaria TaxID=390919 RepID=A0ABM7GMT6_9GAMM|nr:hypothetical protein HORIV_44640 [Halomonas olivaria]
METDQVTSSHEDNKLDGLLSQFDEAVRLLNQAPAFSKPAKLPRVMDTARRVLLQDGGCEALESRAQAFEDSGVFLGSDWETPQYLVPTLTTFSLKSADANVVVIEALSELRLLAVAKGNFEHPLVSSEHAHHYLTQVMAINLWLLFLPPARRSGKPKGDWRPSHASFFSI